MQHVLSVASIVQGGSDAVDAQCVNVHCIVTLSPTAETVAEGDKSDSANRFPPDVASNMHTFVIVVGETLVE
jgi:hypothetical protein